MAILCGIKSQGRRPKVQTPRRTLEGTTQPRQMSEITIFFLHTQIKSEILIFPLHLTGFLRVLDGLISVPCFFLPLARRVPSSASPNMIWISPPLHPPLPLRYHSESVLYFPYSLAGIYLQKSSPSSQGTERGEGGLILIKLLSSTIVFFC